MRPAKASASTRECAPRPPGSAPRADPARRHGVAGADVDHVDVQPGTPDLGLNHHHAERGTNALRRVTAGPQMARHGADGHLEGLGQLALRLRHVTVLTLLPAEPR